MSMVSTGTAAQQAPLPALPMEADPSGFTERAPALSSLLPDEALSRALAGGDALAVHAALVARSSRERSGPTRATVRALLAQPALFAVSEAPPRLGVALGTGVALVGLPPAQKQTEPFIATRAVRLLGMPVWPLSQHLVRRGRDGQLEVMGRVPNALGFRALRWLSRVAAGLVVLAGVGAGLSPFAVRELFIVNGLSRPVVVSVDGKPVRLQPGHMEQRFKLSLGEPYRVSATWEGESRPFEELSVEASQRAVYNVLGASSLVVEGQPVPYASHKRPLEGTVASLSGEETLVVSAGGWERRVNEEADLGRTREAAALAVAVAMADPLSTRAREEAARYVMRLGRDEVPAIALKLQHRHPEDLAINRLVQDLLVAAGQESGMRRFFSQPRFREATSVQPALLYARSQPPDEVAEAHAAVLKRFPEAPEALRALAHLRLADGYSQRALELLEAARSKAPESFEDLELRVRTLVSLRQVREASGAVREYAHLSGHRSWELAVLAGRLARLAGPERTQHRVEELAPPGALATPEAKVAFALLTGVREVSNTELAAISHPMDREALELTRTTLTNLDFGLAQALSADETVLRRVPLEAAAVLALGLSARGQLEAADRVFRSHFALMHAREPLEAYVRTGELKPHFRLVAPELLSAAFLVRSRHTTKDAFVQRAYARWTEVLGGFARRALDPKYEEPVAPEVKPAEGSRVPRPW